MKKVFLDFSPRLVEKGHAARYLSSVCLLLAVGTALVLGQWFFLRRGGSAFLEGAPSPRTYRVISPLKYEDRAATETLKRMAGKSVAGVVVRDPAARERMRRALRDLAGAPGKERAPLPFSRELLKAIMALDGKDRSRLLSLAAEAGEACLDRVESQEGLMGQGNETPLLWEEIGKRVPSPEEANLIYQLLMELGASSYRVDDRLTESVRRRAENGVPIVERKPGVGDVIVAQGDVITPQAAELLRLQGYTEGAFPITQLIFLAVLACVLPLWLDILAHGARGAAPSWRCVVFVVSIAWLFQMLGFWLDAAGAGALPAVLASCLSIPGPFAFSVALAGTTSGVSVIVDLGVHDLLLLLSMGVVAPTCGFYLLRRLESREQMLLRGLLLAVSLSALRMLIRWIEGIPLTWSSFSLLSPVGRFWVECSRFVLLDFLMIVFTVTAFPMIEGYIGVLSILRLRELSHPSSPLLRKMQRDAPGTYQHCLTIATLAEAVALELGMDENLMKAGAYYHDIGKLRRPQFFVENQGGGLNIHDEMSPTMSALSILSHVREGLELARQYDLPRRIQDFIAEHHGTTCIRYFYNKARAEGENVERSAFCYPGPKPGTRETALLMLLDSMEAALRSESLGRELLTERQGNGVLDTDRNRGRSQAIEALRKVIDQVTRSKIDEGQFDEVDLTQGDLTRIKEALLSVLLSMYHTRRVKKIERRPEQKPDQNPEPEARP